MHKRISLALAVLVMLASGYGIWAASGWPWKAALFPLAIGVPLFAMALAEALWVLMGSTPAEGPELAAEAPGRAVLVGGAWMLAFFAAILLIGFPIAVPLFVFLYLKLQGGEGWVMSVVITAAVWGVFYGLFDALLHLPFPSGLLLEWLGLA